MSPRGMERDRSIKAVLKGLDLNCAKKSPVSLHTKPRQENFLQVIIKDAEKETTWKKSLPLLWWNAKDRKNKKYDSETLREHISKIVKEQSIGTEENGIELQQRRLLNFFLKGSDALPSAYLVSIGYKKSKARGSLPRAKVDEPQGEDFRDQTSTTSEQVQGEAVKVAQKPNQAGTVRSASAVTATRELRTRQPRDGSYSAQSDNQQTSPPLDEANAHIRLAMQDSGQEATAPPALALAQIENPRKRRPDEASVPNERTQQPAAKRVKDIPNSNTKDLTSVSVQDAETGARTAAPRETPTTPDGTPKPKLKSFSLKGPKSQPSWTKVSGLTTAPSSGSQHEPHSDPIRKRDQENADREASKSKHEEAKRGYKKPEENIKPSHDALTLSTKNLRPHEKSSNRSLYKDEGDFRVSAMEIDSMDKPAWKEEETDPSKRLYGLGLPLLKSGDRALAEQTAQWPPPLDKDCDMTNYFMCCDQTLRKEMNKVCTSTAGVVAHYLANSNAAKAGQARVIDCPGPELEKIYQTLFGSENGKSWRIEAQSLLEGGMPYYEFLKGLIGAAVHNMVFSTGGLPWDAAEQAFNALRPYALYLSQAQDDRGSTLAVDMWHALYRKTVDPQFQDCEVMSKAREYAARLAITLLPQLKELGITGPGDPSLQGFHKVASAHLTSGMMAALTAKTLIERMPVEKQFKWYATGMTYDCDAMELQAGSLSPQDAGPESVVARAITPLLKYRSSDGPCAQGMTIPAMSVWLMRKD